MVNYHFLVIHSRISDRSILCVSPSLFFQGCGSIPNVHRMRGCASVKFPISTSSKDAENTVRIQYRFSVNTRERSVQQSVEWAHISFPSFTFEKKNTNVLHCWFTLLIKSCKFTPYVAKIFAVVHLQRNDFQAGHMSSRQEPPSNV